MKGPRCTQNRKLLLCERPQDPRKMGSLEEERRLRWLTLRNAPGCAQKPRRGKALALRKAQDSRKIRHLEEESRLNLLALRKAPTCTHDKNLKEERRLNLLALRKDERNMGNREE